MARHNAEWVTIPVAPKYEMNLRGDVRNKNTGRILKVFTSCHTRNSVSLFTDSGQKHFSFNNLLWLTHGIVAKKTSIALPAIINKGNELHYFDSLSATAKFLATRENYFWKTIFNQLVKRRTEIYGWRINYQR